MEEIIKIALGVIGIICVAPITSAFTTPKFWLGISTKVGRCLRVFCVFMLGACIGSSAISIQLQPETTVQYGSDYFFLATLAVNFTGVVILVIADFVAKKRLEFKD